MTTWILVSDMSRARLFASELRELEWTLVEEFEHPEGREKSGQIEDGGPPGHMQQGRTLGSGRTAFEPRTTPKEAVNERFVQQLAGYLEEAIARREFDNLVLVAPPHLLGLVRGALGRQTQKHLKAAVDKDLVNLDAAELRQRLVDVAFPLHAAGGAK